MSGGVTLTGVATALGAAASLYTLSGAGAKKPDAALPAPPAVSEPTKLPTPEPSRKAAEQASLAEQMRRRGRASTILTDTGDSDKLGV